MTRKKVVDFLWVVLLILLPFTSLPLASKILQSKMVAAPSILPLFFLILLCVFPIIFLGKLKEISYPLILFLVYCVLSSIIAQFSTIPIYKEFNIFRNIAEAYITLLIGIAFFVLPVHYLENHKLILQTLHVIYFTFLPVFLWSIFQFVFEIFYGGFPIWMENFQKIFSTSGLLYDGRVTGFAFEPSWLAHQLNMLYIPIFLGSILSGYTIFKKKLFHISLETIFLIASIFLLFLTKSRIGWITFIFCFLYVILTIYKDLMKKLRIRFMTFNKKMWDFVIPVLLVIILISIVISGIYISSKFDPRMEKVLNIETYKNRDFITIANEFLFAERILYWETGWKIFNEHPIIGVGLGNYGFYFEKYMPAFASVLDEPREILFRANYQANNKNLWTRLLSETGIIGFIIYVTWLILLWIQGSELKKKQNQTAIFMGHVLKIALIALIFEGFSIDSFALPYIWIIFGICSASFYVFHRDSITQIT